MAYLYRNVFTEKIEFFSKNSKNFLKSALQGMFSVCINFGDLGIPL